MKIMKKNFWFKYLVFCSKENVGFIFQIGMFPFYILQYVLLNLHKKNFNDQFRWKKKKKILISINRMTTIMENYIIGNKKKFRFPSISSK